MSLPWFAFNADAYTGDTAHLTCEEHGAYLLLMLAYYRSERPLPATDRALSSITKLPLDRWSEAKPTLAAFFVEEDGLWHHERIEREIRDGHARRETNTARAALGGAAKAAKRKLSAQPKSASSMLGMCLDPAPLPLPIDSLSTVRLTVEKAESGDNPPETREIAQSNPLGRAYRELVDNGIVEPDPPELSPIPTSYWPPPPIESVCLADADASTFHLEVQKFIFYQQQNGALSADWDASFQIWWQRFTAYKRDKPKPKVRVEVNTTDTGEPPAINWDWHLKRWLTNQSTWSFRTAGPEPGHPGCRVPPEMFEKHGIDPATGVRTRETI